MTEVSEEANVPPRRKRGMHRRALGLFTSLLSGLLMLVIVISSGVFLRLNAGPVNLVALLPVIEQTASSFMPGVHLKLGGVRLELSDEVGAALTVTDAVLIDDEYGAFAKAPEISAGFRTADLFSGRFIPRDIVLTGIAAQLVKSPEGKFRFGFVGPDDDGTRDGVELFRRLIAAAAADNAPEVDTTVSESEFPEAPARGRLRFRDTSITYIDRKSGREYYTSGARLSFWSGQRGLAARAEVSLEGGRHGRVDVTFRGRRSAEGEIRLRAEIENAAPVDIAGQISALDWMRAIDAPVGGRIDLRLDKAQELTALSGRLTAGQGVVALGGGAVEPITAAALDFTYDPESKRFQVGEVMLDALRAGFQGTGFVQVNRDEAGKPSDVVAQLDFSDIHVTAPEFFDGPLDYNSGRLTGRVTLDPLLIEIGELRLDRDLMKLDLAGRLTPGEQMAADFTAVGSNINLQDLLSHWPRQAAPGAREWVAENMEAAHVSDVDAVVRLGGGDDELKIDFTFDSGVGYPLRPMPPIREAAGSGQVDLKRFSISLDKGFVTPEGGNPIDGKGSSFIIADLDDPVTPGTAKIHATGTINDALKLIDSKPLELTSKLDVPLGDVEGTVVVDVETTLPLLKDLLLDDVKVKVNAVLSDVALLAPGIEKTVQSKALTLDGDTTAFDLAGDIVLAGIPASVTWREIYTPSSRIIRARTVVTPKRLANLGLQQKWFTGGQIPVVATVSPGAKLTTFDVSADLKTGELRLEEIDWTKPKGQAGKLKAKGKLAGKALTLSALDFRSGDLAVAGALSTDANGEPDSVDLSELRYRGGVDLKLKGKRKGKRWDLVTKGPLLDFTKLDDLIDDVISDGSGEVRDSGAAVAPFRVDMDIAELKVLEDRTFNDVSGFLRRTGRDVVLAEFKARLDAGALLNINFRRAPEGGRLRVKTDNGGRFMRDAKVFDDGSGGVMVMRADIPKGEPFRLDGELRVRDIIIHKDAMLEQMLGDSAVEDLKAEMRENGIVLDSIYMPFTYGEGIITLKDAVAKGPSIGVNISGEYGLETDQLNMNGVFTPFYRINSFVGKIPLIGDILTGGDGQGLFAFVFAVTGSSGDPDVSVNPLSILTPGILRKIFEGAAKVDTDEEIGGSAQIRR